MSTSSRISSAAYVLLGVVLATLLLFSIALSVRAEGDVVTPDGEDGANAGQVIATSSDGTGGQHDIGGTITTGDATATTSSNNELNLNEVSPDTACDPGACTNSSTITGTSSNDALVWSFATATASTGANMAEGGQGLATIVTGNAFAFANVINLINTNIFNSVGLLVFLNEVFSTGLDLRDYNLSYFFDGEAGASPTENPDTGEPQCTLLTCLNSSNLNVLSTNTATVTNEVIVRAGTGDNNASTTMESDAVIDTGDAYAAANVVNLVNTNIINSSYLLVSFNNFGDLDGNITLPGGSFFSDLFARSGSAPAMNSSTYGVYNDNLGTTTGTTTTSADTGNNLASTTGEGSGIISTGDAYSQSTEFTDMNKNYVGGTSAFFMFRVAGEWAGSVKSLPNGLSFFKMYDVAQKDGIFSTSTLVLVTSEDALEHAPEGLQDPEGNAEANCDGPNSPDNPEHVPINNCYNSSNFLASSTNEAVIQNNIDVAASTGQNVAITEDGTAHIITGDAYAIANVVNLINTNIVGRNWIFALFNVLGDWRGDISFGKSDLMLEAAAQVGGPVAPGSTVSYVFTITNNGDRDADDIELRADFDQSLLSFEDGTPTDTGRRWSIDTVPQGETRTVTINARVGSVPAGTALTVPVAATVTSDGNGSEAQASFTLATVEVVAPPAPSGGGGGGGGGGGSSSKTKKVATSKYAIPATSPLNPDIVVAKEVVRIGTTTPTMIDYKVVITNAKKGGALYDGKLVDTLYNPDGTVLYNRSWDIGAMAAGEQITLTYSVEFSTTTAPGTYRNVAQISGNRRGSGIQGKPFAPVQGESSVVLGGGAPMVLGAATDCSLAVNQSLRRGMINPEVTKLQRFLNTQGSTLPLTGFFGPMTEASVRTFQSKYASDILAPIGLSYPTGAVGPMTISKIKSLTCGSAPAASL